jgi:hypothetical protein
MTREKPHNVMNFRKKTGVWRTRVNIPSFFNRNDSYGAEAFYYKTATLLVSPLSDQTNEPCGCLNLGLIKWSRHQCVAAAANSGSNGECGSQICDHIIGYRMWHTSASDWLHSTVVLNCHPQLWWPEYDANIGHVSRWNGAERI